MENVNLDLDYQFVLPNYFIGKPFDKDVSTKFCPENTLNAKPTWFSSGIFLKQFLKDTIL